MNFKFLFLTVIATAALADAQTRTVVPVQYSTADEQIEAAQRLLPAIAAAENSNDRAAAVADVAAHLEIVAQIWPNDRDAVLRACLVQSDAFIQGGWVPNAIDLLKQRCTDVARGRAEASLVQARLGIAHQRLNDREEARRAFESAAGDSRAAALPVSEQLFVLRHAAQFFKGAGKDEEAGRLYARAARVEGIPAVVSAQYGVFAAQAYERAGQSTLAAREALRARGRIAAARAEKPQGDSWFDTLTGLEERVRPFLKD